MLWLVDVDAFRRELDNHWPFTKDEQSKHGIADMAESILLAVLNNNAVPVVRCKDCKHYTEPNIEYCELYGAMILWSKDDFCSRGERRTDE